MVKIFKALNGSFNCEIVPAQLHRLFNRSLPAPGNLTMYKSSFSATFSREAAEFIVKNRIVQEYYYWLNGTDCADEHFWATIAGNSDIINTPGAFPVGRWLKELKESKKENQANHYISRYQVWPNEKCGGQWGSGSCIFGIDDLPRLGKRRELVVHKLQLDFEPVTYYCLFEAVRSRTFRQIAFDSSFYENMPGTLYMSTSNKTSARFFPFDNSTLLSTSSQSVPLNGILPNNSTLLPTSSQSVPLHGILPVTGK